MKQLEFCLSPSNIRKSLKSQGIPFFDEKYTYNDTSVFGFGNDSPDSQLARLYIFIGLSGFISLLKSDANASLVK